MQLPARFGKYELQEFLGGGMSHVYRALDTVIGRQVAVKILTDEACREPEAQKRFLHEARVAGTIQHDHVVTIHDYGEEQGRPYIVMEFLRGWDLKESMRRGQTGDFLNRLRIATECATAMEFVHGRGIIHRDIKPENIFLELSGRAKIMDFGISKAVGFSLTKAGNTMGTPYYMSPEQVTGAEVTALVDIYSFGAVLYELFTGERLVAGETMERLFYVILHESPNPAMLAAAGVPRSLSELIIRCTAKTPDARIQSFGEIRHRLNGIMDDARGAAAPVAAPASTMQYPPLPPPPRRAGPEAEPKRLALWPIVAVGVGVLVLSGIAMWMLLGQKNSPPPPPRVVELPALIDAKGGKMALIPAGSFLFGSSRTPVKLPAFYLDVTEVSNREYGEFAAAAHRGLPKEFRPDAADLPVGNVTFADAEAFCAWAGKRLPNEREWEKGARGVDGRNYPWGNDEVAAFAVAGGKPLAPVGSLEAGASPFKLLHMTGNVMEWIDHPHTPSTAAVKHFAEITNPPATASEAWHYVKGGSYDLKLAEGVTYEWGSVPARFTSPAIGFRCAQDPPSAK